MMCPQLSSKLQVANGVNFREKRGYTTCWRALLLSYMSYLGNLSSNQMWSLIQQTNLDCSKLFDNDDGTEKLYPKNEKVMQLES